MSNKFRLQNKACVNKLLCINACKKVMMLVLTLLFCCNLFAQPPATPASNKTAALFQAIRSGSTEQLQQQLLN